MVKLVLPSNGGLMGCVGSFSVTLETARSQLIATTNTVISTITAFETIKVN